MQKRYREDSSMRTEDAYEDRVVQVNRTSKKTGGGNRIGFSVLVVVGDRSGNVGAGLGKAPDVLGGIRKGSVYAKKHMIFVRMKDTRTIPHRIEVKYGAAKILLKPAPKGSGIIAGSSVRTVLELAGLKDVVGKILGTNNKITNVYATMKALALLREPKNS